MFTEKDCKPELFLLNDLQTSFVLASENECIFYDMDSDSYVDLDEKFKIGSIKQIMYDIDDHAFYILANKFEKKQGLYLIKFDQKQPHDHKFLI